MDFTNSYQRGWGDIDDSRGLRKKKPIWKKNIKQIVVGGLIAVLLLTLLVVKTSSSSQQRKLQAALDDANRNRAELQRLANDKDAAIRTKDAQLADVRRQLAEQRQQVYKLQKEVEDERRKTADNSGTLVHCERERDDFRNREQAVRTELEAARRLAETSQHSAAELQRRIDAETEHHTHLETARLTQIMNLEKELNIYKTAAAAAQQQVPVGGVQLPAGGVGQLPVQQQQQVPVGGVQLPAGGVGQIPAAGVQQQQQVPVQGQAQQVPVSGVQGQPQVVPGQMMGGAAGQQFQQQQQQGQPQVQVAQGVAAAAQQAMAAQQAAQQAQQQQQAQQGAVDPAALQAQAAQAAAAAAAAGQQQQQQQGQAQQGGPTPRQVFRRHARTARGSSLGTHLGMGHQGGEEAGAGDQGVAAEDRPAT